MKSPLRNALNVATGRYWWVLIVRSVSDIENSAQIVRVVRGLSKRKSFVCLSYSGTLEECRLFQIQHGGADDGILLVDDTTPVKIVSDEGSTIVDFPGYKSECWEYAGTLSGDFSIVALHSAVEGFALDIQKLGFKILIHLPFASVLPELIEHLDNAPCIYTNNDDEYSRLYLALDGKIVVGYKILGQDTGKLEKYICEQYLLKNPVKQSFSIDAKEIAKIVADDAWLFKTDNMSGFHTPADKSALQRLRDASLFRKVTWTGIVVLLMSLLVVLSLGIVDTVYQNDAQTKIQMHKSIIQKQKELALIWEKLEKEKTQFEDFLKHRSRLSTSIRNFASIIPEDVWIVHWSVSQGVHSVQGYAVTSKNLSDFLETLETDHSFINVRLRTTEKTSWKKYDVVRFDLTAEDVK